MTALYLEDLAVGQKFGSGRVRVDAEAIKAFATEFDPQPFHLDEDAAKASFFQGLAASGWHTAALTMRLLVTGEFKPAGGLVGVSNEISWSRPVRPGEDRRSCRSGTLHHKRKARSYLHYAQPLEAQALEPAARPSPWLYPLICR